MRKREPDFGDLLLAVGYIAIGILMLAFWLQDTIKANKPEVRVFGVIENGKYLPISEQEKEDGAIQSVDNNDKRSKRQLHSTRDGSDAASPRSL